MLRPLLAVAVAALLLLLVVLSGDVGQQFVERIQQWWHGSQQGSALTGQLLPQEPPSWDCAHHSDWLERRRQANLPDVVRLSGQAMGTDWLVLLAAQDTHSAHDDSDHSAALSPARQRALGVALAAELEQVEQAASHYRPNSQLGQINHLAPNQPEPVQVPHPLRQILTLAAQMHAQTNGAFDPALGQLSAAWGFAPWSQFTSEDKPAAAPSLQRSIPSVQALAQAQSLSGWDKVDWHPGTGLLSKRANVLIDLSAIAKGWAVDRMAHLLDEAGFEHYLIEVGGEIRTLGSRNVSRNVSQGVSRDGSEDGDFPWCAGIRNPQVGNENGAVLAGVPMPKQGAALATSGDAFQFFVTPKGGRHSHTLDASSGRASKQLASASVLMTKINVASNANAGAVTDADGDADAAVNGFLPMTAMADAWATALVSQSAAGAWQSASQHNLPVLIVPHDHQLRRGKTNAIWKRQMDEIILTD